MKLRGKSLQGVLVACMIGIASVLVSDLSDLAILDPLVVALVVGILIRSFITPEEEFKEGLKLAPSLFIPVGVILYGAVNLNFAEFASVDTNYIFILFLVILVYILSTLLFARLFGLNEKTGYLIAAGSAICGASAIAITSKVVDAEPDDVSNSLISVFLVSLSGLFIILPVLWLYLRLTPVSYGVLSGTVLQFTGFVKMAASPFSESIKTIAITVKATRYLGLLFVVPLFSSFVRGRLHVPWYLLGFLFAGVLFFFFPDVAALLRPSLKLTLEILWSIAMAAIGLNAQLDVLFTVNSLKALAVSFLAFLLAIGVFLLGLTIA